MLIETFGGKKDFAISRNSQIVRDIALHLRYSKRQTAIESVAGQEPNEQQKTKCHRSAKLGWKHCPVGFGELSEVIFLLGVDLQLLQTANFVIRDPYARVH